MPTDRQTSRQTIHFDPLHSTRKTAYRTHICLASLPSACFHLISIDLDPTVATPSQSRPVAGSDIIVNLYSCMARAEDNYRGGKVLSHMLMMCSVHHINHRVWSNTERIPYKCIYIPLFAICIQRCLSPLTICVYDNLADCIQEHSTTDWTNTNDTTNMKKFTANGRFYVMESVENLIIPINQPYPVQFVNSTVGEELLQNNSTNANTPSNNDDYSRGKKWLRKY